MAILAAIDQTKVSRAGTSNLLNWYIPIGLVVGGMKFNEC